MNKNLRYEILPQMRIYDQIGYRWLPFIMFSQTPNFRSDVLNTDNKGLRFNSIKKIKKSIIDPTINKESIIIMGSSYAFGVGSTSDENSISGILEKTNKNYNYLSLTGRAYVGFQELILLFANFNRLRNIKKIIIISGIADIYLSNFYINNYPDVFYFQSNYINEMSTNTISFKKKIIKNFLNLFNPDFVTHDEIFNMNKNSFLKFLFSKEYRKSYRTSNQFDHHSLEHKLNRNFMLYKTLEKHFDCEVYFLFQPVLNWCKEKSKDEELLSDYSNKYFSKINQHLQKIITKENHQKYNKLFNKVASNNSVKFYDTNEHLKKFLSKKDWIFVDNAHCNDAGYKLIAEFINTL